MTHPIEEMSRSHPGCWNAEKQGYIHICQKRSGNSCIEADCAEPAGTLWGPLWCPEHDVERLDRISRSFDDISRQLHGASAMPDRQENER